MLRLLWRVRFPGGHRQPTWLSVVGDAIDADEPLLEVSTDALTRGPCSRRRLPRGDPRARGSDGRGRHGRHPRDCSIGGRGPRSAAPWLGRSPAPALTALCRRLRLVVDPFERRTKKTNWALAVPSCHGMIS